MLCFACANEVLRWLDYRPRQPLRIASDATYDDTPAGAADNRRHRADQWAATIRTQQALIRTHCQENHDGPPNR